MAEAEFQYSETAINERDEDTKEYDVELPGVVANDDTAITKHVFLRTRYVFAVFFSCGDPEITAIVSPDFCRRSCPQSVK